MTTSLLRNSILALTLAGCMTLPGEALAQGRRGGFGGGGHSQSGMAQSSRSSSYEGRAPGRATASPERRSSYSRPNEQGRQPERMSHDRNTERSSAQSRYAGREPQGVTPRSAQQTRGEVRYGSESQGVAPSARPNANAGTAQMRPQRNTGTIPGRNTFGSHRQDYATPSNSVAPPELRRENASSYRRPDGNRGDRPGGNFGNGNRGDRPDGGRPGNNFGFNNRGNRDYGRDYDGRRPGYHRPQHGNPRGFDNQFNRRYHDYYRHNSWSWSHPCRPPYRPWRPAPWVAHRPIIPVGWTWYHAAPRIYRVLGLQFGTVFSVSLNHLFTYGYNIDGYYDNVIYLRDVPMLNFSWPNVMLTYASGGGLATAMFSNSFATRDLGMYNRLYSTLCGTYGSPVEARTTPYEGTVSWWGGEGQGYVTLNYYTDQNGRFYTNLTVGN